MKGPRVLRQYLLWAVAVVIVLTSMQLFAAKGEAKGAGQEHGKAHEGVAGATFVGSEQCKACHEDQFKNVQGSPHYKTIGPNGGRDSEMHGCENCHGAGSAHVESGGDKTKIFTFKDMKADELSERCLTCHSKNMEHASFQRSVHNRAGVSCTSCHAIHTPKVRQRLLTQKPTELCFSCHGETKADFTKPFHHKVIEGLVTCSDCHNVHSGQGVKQIRMAASQDATCYKCHAEKRGPFVFEHEPVRTEGCSACHTPHGSTNPRLLTRSRTNSLCLECHQNFYSGPHPQNTKSQSCTLCHVSIHGSQTSEVFFK